MDFKKDIVGVLEELKKLGFSRRDIEKSLKYSEKTIDQTLSRGGNATMLNSLKEFLNETKLKGIPPSVKNHEELTQAATLKMLFEEIVKIKSKLFNQRIEDARSEMEESTTLIIKDILKGKQGS